MFAILASKLKPFYFFSPCFPLYVASLEEPAHKPILITDKLKYLAGETIRANCTTPKAFPAPNITWFINEQMVNDTIYNRIMPTTFRDIDGLETVNSKLEFSSKPSYYKDGKMTLKCVANQFGIYKQRTEQKLEDDSPQLAHVLSPSTTLSHRHKFVSSALVGGLSRLLSTNPVAVFGGDSRQKRDMTKKEVKDSPKLV
ncbi:hypothetical protein V9T40_008078 [Parthenolecanium corni]|uniref:Ig-like domain-containing protein n=1 Tax=Parthenolecanium corni TaxID=536013 RepID=A0AAN9TZZ6_9HEMI